MATNNNMTERGLVGTSRRLPASEKAHATRTTKVGFKNSKGAGAPGPAGSPASAARLQPPSTRPPAQGSSGQLSTTTARGPNVPRAILLRPPSARFLAGEQSVGERAKTIAAFLEIRKLIE